MIELLVEECGPQCSIQDGGRLGVGRLGLALAGAMDPRALATANTLVGNGADAAAVEMMFTGGRFRAVGGGVRVAIAGSLASVMVDGRTCRTHCSILLAPGEQLELGRAQKGVYAMLAVAGGFDVPLVMGSRALDVRAMIGGQAGRALAPGDLLPIAHSPEWRGPERRTPPVSLDPDASIRVVMGPQDDAFTSASIDAFLASPFRVSHQISRMAYRLEGPPLLCRQARDMISDATLPGSIQVPPDGAPLVLMADRQTVGGYPKIATVASADLPRLGRLLPGQVVRFQPVTVEEAEALRRDQEARIERAIGRFQAARPPGGIDLGRLYEENLIDGVVFHAPSA